MRPDDRLQNAGARARVQIEALVGSVVELASITGVAVPSIEAIYRAVKLLARTPIAERAASA